MANISAIKLPSGTTYTIVDKTSGYTKNTGTVTSVAASGSGGISISGSPITTSGTIAIGLNLSTAINGLGEGTSSAQRTDYIVAQYAGGGTTTTTYHRRSLANIFAALNASDITTALGYTPYNSTNPNGYVTSSGITSVTIAATSPVVSSTASAQTGSSASTTISLANAYGDTKNPYGTKTANYVLAGPASGSAAAPTFRALVAADIPISDWAKASSKPSYTFSEIGSKPTTLSGYGITNAYTKTEVDGLVAGVLHYKGTKATVSALPSSGNTTGDTWHVTADGSEWAWDGSTWQELGTAIDLSGYAQLSGASFTGPVEFGDSVTADTISTGGLVVSGDAVFTNNLAANTINGVTVGSNPKFTDTVPTTTQSKVTGISIAAHGTTSIGSASGWNAGTASTWAFEEVSIPNVTSAGSASTWAFEEKSIPNVTSAGTASSWTFEEKSIPNVTAAGSGSASLTFAMDTTDTKKLKITFSHTHTPPTIGTAIKVQSKSGGSNGTAPTLGTAIKVQSKSSGANSTAPTIGTAIKVQSKKSGANSTVPSLTVTSTTVVTGATHTVTDNGHTHAI